MGKNEYKNKSKADLIIYNERLVELVKNTIAMKGYKCGIFFHSMKCRSLGKMHIEKTLWSESRMIEGRESINPI